MATPTRARRRRVTPLIALAALPLLLGSEGAVDAKLLAALAVMLIAAKLAGDIFERLGQPPVLGELAAGILIGNLPLLGFDGLAFIRTDPQLALLSELGVVFLLFTVGLESNLGEMRRVGVTAMLVATIGVIFPMALGFGVHLWLAPDRTWHTHLFVGAVLTATSVGITARVLKDLGKIDTPTGRVVLGAAVIDDVLGLIVLAVVTGVVDSAATGRSLDTATVLLIIGKAVGFLGVAIVLGPWMSGRLYKTATYLRVHGVLLAASIALCLTFAYTAHVVGLAFIVGAFAAGLILDEVVYKDLATREEVHLEEQMKPIGEFLTPLFFVITGAQVQLDAFADSSVLGLAAALTFVAVIGKQACALVARGPGIDRFAVGLGMIPRGEVGLIFAAAGAKLVLDGRPVVEPSTYAAIVVMVMVTTMVTPPLLAWKLRT
jgi:Kef-type K+ transport system membrane component KefB